MAPRLRAPHCSALCGFARNFLSCILRQLALPGSFDLAMLAQRLGLGSDILHELWQHLQEPCALDRAGMSVCAQRVVRALHTNTHFQMPHPIHTRTSSSASCWLACCTLMRRNSLMLKSCLSFHGRKGWSSSMWRPTRKPLIVAS